MKWNKKEKLRLSELGREYYIYSVGQNLSQEEMIGILNLNQTAAAMAEHGDTEGQKEWIQKAKDYTEKRTQERKNLFLENTTRIRREARKIIGKDLMLYFFPIWGVDSFEKFKQVRKKYNIHGFSDTVYGFVCHNKKPLWLAVRHTLLSF